MTIKIDLKEIEKKANEFAHVEDVARELKRVQSMKSRLKRQKGKKTYEQEMVEVLKEEQLLKEVRQLIAPKKKVVTRFTQEDVNKLDYNETMKAIRNIQSKKTLSKWLTPIEGDNDEYRNACEIEAMLLERREEIKPVDDSNVRKTDVQTIIDTIEESGNLSQEKIVELLKKLV